MESMSLRRSDLRWSLLAGVALLIPAVASAQSTPSIREQPTTTTDADQDTAGTIKTARTADGAIIVTARNYVPQGAQAANKTNIPLIETPQSVSVVTRDQIDLLNFTDAQQAVRYTAGVFGENYGPDLRFDFFTVRGFTPKQYIDGLAAPISTTIYSVGLDLYAFQSLELLKGPASVLYGNAPPGGIYNETSRRAADELGGELNLKYGSYGYKQVSGTITGPLAHGFDARLTGLYLDRHAEVEHVRDRRALIAPTATWTIGSNTKLTGLAYYQNDHIRGGGPGFLPVQGTLLPNPNGKLSHRTNLESPDYLYRRNQWGVGYDFLHRFGAATFRSNAKWSRYKEATPYGAYDSGGFVNTTNPALPNYFRDVTISNFTYRERVNSFAIDNRVEGTFDTGAIRNKFLVGVDYRNVRNAADFGFDFGIATVNAYDPVWPARAASDFGYPTRYNHQRLKQTGTYAQDQLKIGNFYLLAGARYDWVRSRYLDPFTAVTAPAGTNRTRAEKFTYRVGGSYVTRSGLAPYISYSTSFEPQIGVDGTTSKAFKPSTGKQVEGGVKYDGRALSPNVRVFATAALFDIKQTNVVSTTPSVSPVFGTQSGKVEVYGGELEFVARIRNQLSFNGSYSYNHSRVLESNTAAEIGQPLPTTPKHKASLFGDYSFQNGALAGFGLGGGVRYTSKSAGSLPGPFNPVVYYGQAATLFDAILHYDAPHYRVSLNGSNIFDKRYVARCSGPAGCVYGSGRQILLTLTGRF
ncbi:TonB-dependent siderophore receptor [Sphingomonas ginkgonis]|uniref:TonB-dependent siderophore receptor n=1 Tax=Sphingomonas ginkgonis TaxID=2315330 RepID=A0A429V8H2_9SPHN|nr:TonB-dependent siderophore receptor [Sphingomonas ginkgonis]RST30261.1 TonB-dependent siderophore receptor [Sphingomonas ginkgonis]